MAHGTHDFEDDPRNDDVAPHWYEAVWASTGFAPWRPREVALPEHHARVAEACRPVYERLHARI